MQSITSTEATTVMSGSFLSGAMMSLSFIAVPVLLDTTTEASQLSFQWARMYHYGHKTMPTLAVSTFLCYAYTIYRRRAKKQTWKAFAVAGLVTVSMLPFTWVCMAPTNNELFRMQAITENDMSAIELVSVQNLVTRWSWLHFTRTLLPLTGTVLGMLAMLQD